MRMCDCANRSSVIACIFIQKKCHDVIMCKFFVNFCFVKYELSECWSCIVDLLLIHCFNPSVLIYSQIVLVNPRSKWNAVVYQLLRFIVNWKCEFMLICVRAFVDMGWIECPNRKKGKTERMVKKSIWWNWSEREAHFSMAYRDTVDHLGLYVSERNAWLLVWGFQWILSLWCR